MSFIQLKMSLSASIKERNAEKNSLTVHSAIDVICAVVHKYTSQVVLKLDLQVFSKLIEARFD